MAILDVQTLLGIAVVVIIVLVIKYPDRVLFTEPNSDDLPTLPRPLPLIGDLWEIIKPRPEGRGRQLHGMLEMQKRSGPKGDKEKWAKTVTVPPFGRLYMINRPEYLQHVQKNNFANYPKGDWFRSLFADVLGINGIFVADGEVWKAQRKLASNIFSVSNFKSHVQTCLHRELGVLSDLLTNLSKTGVETELQDTFFRFTLASFGLMAFGKDFETLPSDPASLKKNVPFAQAFDFAQGVLDKRLVTPGWQLIELLSSEGRQMRNSVSIIRNYAVEVIDERMLKREKRDATEADSKPSKGDRDLLDLFMDHGIGREELVDTVLNFIIAGRDTTAQALSWQMWELLNHPEALTKCREEIHRVMADSHLLTYEDLNNLVYLNACFNETLRLHPSVPKNMKQIAEDDVIPGIPEDGIPPFRVKKGEMARMPDIWGEDCAEFKPERWIDENGRLKKFSQFQFHAFNAGPRLCLGQTLATFEAISVTALLVSQYDLALVDGEEPLYANSLTHPIKNPYKVRVSIRSTV